MADDDDQSTFGDFSTTEGEKAVEDLINGDDSDDDARPDEVDVDTPILVDVANDRDVEVSELRQWLTTDPEELWPRQRAAVEDARERQEEADEKERRRRIEQKKEEEYPDDVLVRDEPSTDEILRAQLADVSEIRESVAGWIHRDDGDEFRVRYEHPTEEQLVIVQPVSTTGYFGFGSRASESGFRKSWEAVRDRGSLTNPTSIKTGLSTPGSALQAAYEFMQEHPAGDTGRRGSVAGFELSGEMKDRVTQFIDQENLEGLLSLVVEDDRVIDRLLGFLHHPINLLEYAYGHDGEQEPSFTDIEGIGPATEKAIRALLPFLVSEYGKPGSVTFNIAKHQVNDYGEKAARGAEETPGGTKALNDVALGNWDDSGTEDGSADEFDTDREPWYDDLARISARGGSNPEDDLSRPRRGDARGVVNWAAEAIAAYERAAEIPESVGAWTRADDYWPDAPYFDARLCYRGRDVDRSRGGQATLSGRTETVTPVVMIEPAQDGDGWGVTYTEYRTGTDPRSFVTKRPILAEYETETFADALYALVDWMEGHPEGRDDG